MTNEAFSALGRAAYEIYILSNRAKTEYNMRSDITVTLEELRQEVAALRDAVNQLPELLTPNTP